jgi:TonB family protein
MWYFPRGKLDTQARVVLQVTLDTTGRVEPASINILSTTDSAFIEPARLTILTTTFRPGEADGHKVQADITVPLVFDGKVKPRCEVNNVTPMLPPQC